MNKLEQAAQNLLDYFDIDDCGILFDSHMEALREALAEQAEQEPVGRWNWNEAKFEWLTKFDYHKHHMTPLYAAPQPVKQEPVAEILVNDKDVIVLWHKTARQLGHQAKLYAAPVSIHSESETDSSSSSMRTAVRTKDLTFDEIVKVLGSLPMTATHEEIIRAAIAADREKNK